MDEFVASSSRSEEIFDVSERPEAVRHLEFLRQNCEELNESGLDLDKKGMREYVAYQIDDILEFWNAKEKKGKKKGIILRRLLERCVYGKDMQWMEHEIMMYQVRHETMRIYNLYHNWLPDRVENADRVERLRRRSVVLPKVKHFVGMKEDLKKVVSYLTDSKQPRRVVLVWGVEGSGKTTLATKFFMELQERSHFNAFAWVSPSPTQGQDCQINDLLQNILEQLDESSQSVERTITAQFDEIQSKRKCLIVIDGISEISQWTQISSTLLTTETTKSRSRILLTTRNETIASDGPDGNGVVHKLSKLDENDGWELLQKHAFSEDVCPVKGVTRKLGKEMVRQCKFLPFTICRLGRALSEIKTSEWHSVNDNVTKFLEEDERGKSLSSKRPSHEIVAPRYDHLRFHLKQCFLYLGIFKQDIDAEDLTFLWAAEGMLFAQQVDRDNGTIIDTAERYLQELNSEGMLKVKVDGLSANRIVMPLSLRNDQWALSRYHGEKEGFALYVSDNTAVVDKDQILLSRRWVFHFNKQATSSLTDAKLSLLHIRSLFFLNFDEEYANLPVSMSNFHKLKLLTTVHFVRCKFKGRKLPEEMEKLVRLRYLGIIYCDLDGLPSSLSNSRNLHVLNVRAYDGAKMTIPNIFSKTSSQLNQMKHLRLPSNLEKKSDKLKLDALSNLETLVGFNVDGHDIGSLSNLTKLRLLVSHVSDNHSMQPNIDLVNKYGGSTVQIHVILEYGCNFTSPDELPILEDMLMCPHLYALTFSMVHIHNFPNCGSFASSGLTQLKLIGCKLREDPMKALANFPRLQKLCLGYGAFVGSKIEIHFDHGVFINLEYLEFRCLPNLKEWLVDSRAMPNLSTLTVKRCPKLEKIPDGLTSVSSLKNFEIELPASASSF